MHLPAKLPKPGLLRSPGAVQQIRATGVSTEQKGPGVRTAGPLESPHHRPSGFSQSDAVRHCYANKPSRPSQSGAWAPSPKRPLSPQPRRTGGRVTGNRRSANFPLRTAGKKKKRILWPCRRWAASLVALGTFPVEIWNRLEMLSNQPRPPFASEKPKKLCVEQTTFEYL